MQGTMGKKEERDSQSRFEVSICNFWKRSFKNLSMKKKKKTHRNQSKRPLATSSSTLLYRQEHYTVITQNTV